MNSQTAQAANNVQRSASSASTKVADNGTLSRGGTLKKRQSVKRGASLKRSNSRKSVTAGSIKGLQHADDEYNNVFNTPIPTSGNPTEVLVNRFQAWRKVIKDLVSYFGEIQSSYEHRSKSLLKVSNVLNNTSTSPAFLSHGGLDEANRILRGFHKHSVAEAMKSKDIETDVITQLSGLRSDLSQKIKEIKSLSGDFKNNVEREKDNTRKAVTALQEAITMSSSDHSAAAGKNDPFLARLAVDRQLEKQIEEENYLHRAYLNLEGSGRELESIVVGEIQKAYNAFAGILKREADSAYGTIGELRTGPLSMPKDREWDAFVEHEPHVVNPSVLPRRLDNIVYPEQLNPAATEIRGGLLERKSKYLKSYSPGWYVLSPTHLHEFKSGDHIQTQQPVMSLYLLDQKLGSRSQADASSHKFSLKGRQTGGVHRGHSWVFRAESYDTMMAWYEDIRNLTEKTGAEKTAFVRKHARSISAGSHSAPSVSSDGLDEDEADAVPYAAAARQQPTVETILKPPPKRPDPGGRFPSDINVNRTRGLQAPPSPSSDSSQRRSEQIERGESVERKDVVQHQQPVELPVRSGAGPTQDDGGILAGPYSGRGEMANGTPTQHQPAPQTFSDVDPYPNARQFDDVAYTSLVANDDKDATPASEQNSVVVDESTATITMPATTAGDQISILSTAPPIAIEKPYVEPLDDDTGADADTSVNIGTPATSQFTPLNPTTAPPTAALLNEPTKREGHIPGAFEE